MKDQKPIKCSWRIGSTNPHTMRSEKPELCKMRGCEGEFRKWKDLKEFDCSAFNLDEKRDKE